MPKLAAIRPDTIIKILEKHGFVLDHSSGSHRIYYHSQNKKRVIVPYHKKDIPRGTLLSILKSAGIKKEEL